MPRRAAPTSSKVDATATRHSIRGQHQEHKRHNKIEKAQANSMVSSHRLRDPARTHLTGPWHSPDRQPAPALLADPIRHMSITPSLGAMASRDRASGRQS